MIRLDYPFIRKYYDSFEADKIFYIVSEYPEGGNFEKIINIRLNEKEYLRYFAMLCCGVMHLH